MYCKFSHRAYLDLVSIGDYIAQTNPVRALSFVQELRAHCERLIHAPQRAIVDWIDGLAVRVAPHGNYNIYFSWVEQDECIYVIHIRHASRDMPNFSKQIE